MPSSTQADNLPTVPLSLVLLTVLDCIITMLNFVVIRILKNHTNLLRLFPLPAVTQRFSVISRTKVAVASEELMVLNCIISYYIINFVMISHV